MWEADVFVNPAQEPCPSPIVALVDLLAPVARHYANVQGRKVWLTMPLSRSVCILYRIPIVS